MIDAGVYQGKSGAIYLRMWQRCTKLTHQQITDLGIDIFRLEDFDFDLYLESYPDRRETMTPLEIHIMRECITGTDEPVIPF